MIRLVDFEEYASKHLEKKTHDYYASGADSEQTLRENREAFSRFKIRPRFLRDISNRDLSTSVLGNQIAFPVGIAPTALQRLAHADGEIATAKAAAASQTVMILSTLATSSIEEVAEANGAGLRWFQLYIYKDREVTRQLVSRAEKNGFKALVLTVDTPFFGQRVADVVNKFTLPSHLRMANFDILDVKSFGVQKAKHGSGIHEYSVSLLDPSISWEEVKWLKSITQLPLIIKGILTAEDAILAVEQGASAIIVSNHGGRQLDGVPATIDVLPEIVSVVRGRCEVFLDGGVRTGTDVLKAIALGAKAVFIGRPVLWGLCYSGEAGVKRVLEILKKEFDTALALSGCCSLTDATTDLVVRENYYSRL